MRALQESAFFSHFCVDNLSLYAKLVRVTIWRTGPDGGGTMGEKPCHAERGEKLGNRDSCCLPAPKAHLSYRGVRRMEFAEMAAKRRSPSAAGLSQIELAARVRKDHKKNGISSCLCVLCTALRQSHSVSRRFLPRMARMARMMAMQKGEGRPQSFYP